MKFLCSLLFFCSFQFQLLANGPHFAEILTLDSLVEIQFGAGNYPLALETATQAYKLAIKQGKDSTYAHCVHNLAMIQTHLQQYDKAKELYDEAIALESEIWGATHEKTLDSWMSLGQLYHAQNLYSMAEPIFQKILNTREKVYGSTHPNHPSDLNNLASVYQETGRYAEAEMLFLKAISAYESTIGKENKLYANTISNLAVLYEQMSRYSEAEVLLLQTLHIREKVLGKNHLYYALSLANLGSIYSSLEKYKKAEQYMQEACASWKLILGEQHPYYLRVLNNLANLYTKMKETDKAEPIFKKILVTQKKVFGPTHLNISTSLVNLATLYSQTGSYTKAVELFEQAIIIQEQLLGSHHSDLAVTHNLLALSHLIYKSFEATEKSLSQSICANFHACDSFDIKDLSSLPEQFFLAHDEAILSVEILASIYKKKAQASGDQQFLIKRKEALAIMVQLIDKKRQNLRSEADKLRTFNEMTTTVSKALTNALLIYQEAPNKELLYHAFQQAEQNKSILLSDAIKSKRAISLGDLPEELQEKEMQLQQNDLEIKQELAQAKTAEALVLAKDKQSNHHLEWNQFLQLVKDQYPNYHALKYEPLTASVSEIQALLEEDEALLEYFVADTVLYGFYIDKEQVSLLPISETKDELKKKLKRLRSGLSDYKLINNKPSLAYDYYTNSADWFYQKIVAPLLANSNKDIKHLVIVTDNVLGHLPFEVFLTEAAPQGLSSYKDLAYLCQSYSIRYSYSATLLKTAKNLVRPQHNGQLLAMAAHYNKDTVNINLDLPLYLRKLRKALDPLPEAIAEVKALSESWEGSFLTDSLATESTFKNTAGNYAVIHLAMHGILHQYSPVLSNLAFSEDHGVEDNFLHAYEIAQLKLNADLVVLSACETGYGKFQQGEGILSLARSFMYAGTPALVVSLWPVNDASTAQIMQQFYKNLHQGMTKSSALQQAKITFLNDYEGIFAHPAFWSPFILLGENSPVLLTQKKQSILWPLLAAGFLGLIAVFFYRRRQK